MVTKRNNGKLIILIRNISMPVLLAVIFVFGIFPGVILGNNGFTIAPTKLELIVPESGASPAYIYVTSDIDGELIVGTEEIPFKVEPEFIAVSRNDISKKVELLIHGDPELVEGSYAGKLTFLARTEKNVAYGIKVDIQITQIGETGALLKYDEANSNYYYIIVAGTLVLAAIAAGIIIYRKYRIASVKNGLEEDESSNGENE